VLRTLILRGKKRKRKRYNQSYQYQLVTYLYYVSNIIIQFLYYFQEESQTIRTNLLLSRKRDKVKRKYAPTDRRRQLSPGFLEDALDEVYRFMNCFVEKLLSFRCYYGFAAIFSKSLSAYSLNGIYLLKLCQLHYFSMLPSSG
jgi:hypothetical protein